MQTLSKSLIMPLLMLVVSISFFKTKYKPLKIFLVAMLFSWIGDMLLVKGDEEVYFMAGLGSFFLAQIAYGVSFIQSKEENFNKQLIYRAPISIILLVLVVIVIFIYLKPGMGSLQLPVALYMMAILFMSAMAMNREGKVNRSSFWWVFVGAILFMLSDTLIAINKFDHILYRVEFFVMLTYMAAQFALVHGTLIQAKNQES